jgi:hypothetical protein
MKVAFYLTLGLRWVSSFSFPFFSSLFLLIIGNGDSDGEAGTIDPRLVSMVILNNNDLVR